MKEIQNELMPETFLKIYTSVGWEPPYMEQVKKDAHMKKDQIPVYRGVLWE